MRARPLLLTAAGALALGLALGACDDDGGGAASDATFGSELDPCLLPGASCPTDEGAPFDPGPAPDPGKAADPGVAADPGPAPDAGGATDPGPPADPGGTDAPAPSPAFDTPIVLREWRPHVEAAALGADPIELLIDTGSPVTILDTDHFGGSPGTVDTTLEAFGASWPVVAVRYNFGGSPPPGATLVVGGIIGTDLLAPWSLLIDYRGASATLVDAAASSVALPAGVAAPEVVSFDLLGGGTFGIPGGGSKALGATRPIVQTVIEGQTVDALLDTGAAWTVVHPALFAALGDQGRPRLEGVRLTQSGVDIETTLSRAASVAAGGFEVAGTPIVVAPASIFDALAAETGRDVRLFLGGTWLRHAVVGLDVPARELRLAAYTDAPHIDPAEWIGPGLRLNDGPGGDFLVYDVYDGTHAAAQGVDVGWRLTQLDGEPLDGWTVEAFRAHLSTYAPGTVLDLGWRRDDGSVDVIGVQVEDLLPSWTGP